MKKKHLIILGLLLLLTGCGSKSSFSFDMGDFVVTFYHNDVDYKEIVPDTIDGLEIIKELEEQIDVDSENTGYKNSLFVIKASVESGVTVEDIAETNTQQLTTKLLQYTQLEYTDDTVKCKDNQYPGYISTFSYQLGEDVVYDGQYYLLDGTTLYMLSLSSELEKDVKRFVKSVHKTDCK